MLDHLSGETRATALRAVVELFTERGFDSPGADARALLCNAAQCDRLALVSAPDIPIGPHAAAILAAHINRRLDGEPVTRILGTRAFWTLDLKVTPDVLDPRPDSECLIEAALDRLGERRRTAIRCLDLGTGTGALLLSLLAECPAATGLGIDASQAACDVAIENACRHSLEARARFEVGHWTTGIIGTFDVVMSNPPYIERSKIPDLDRSVVRFDPLLALDGGSDGLSAYREILQGLSGVLEPDGFAVLELGIHQEDRVAAIAAQYGLREAGRRRDLGGVVRALILSR